MNIGVVVPAMILFAVSMLIWRVFGPGVQYEYLAAIGVASMIDIAIARFLR